MRAKPAHHQLTVRSYGRMIDGQWVGVCLNFALVAQADTWEELVRKLGEQIRAYVSEAFNEDSAHRDYLLSRRAPLRDYVIYGLIGAKIALHAGMERIRILSQQVPIPC
jgi:hypothetical protein